MNNFIEFIDNLGNKVLFRKEAITMIQKCDYEKEAKSIISTSSNWSFVKETQEEIMDKIKEITDG